MDDYEKLGVFYLGRPYRLAEKKSPGGLFLYDSKDLVTHAVCVGMTGSGKTGLCISLLEEAAMDGIPAIAIDPKGDLTNLLLTFPDLKPEDFLPWVNVEDAQKKGLTVEEYAAKQAETWKAGLAGWTQDGDRIRRLKQAADFVIYTPGSTSGIPVSILKSFSVPPNEILEDEELLRERINNTATSLLGIIGIDADPIRSREHILISNLLNLAWKANQDIDIARLIQQIQNPPVKTIGVMDINSFYPAKERFGLAMALNNLLAAPGFNIWLEGEPLEINSILYTPEGKPKISVFSIAHLNDSERMFFVSLLLNQILGWMRTQSGTTSLRSIVYMDEISGFFPPVANPPSKQPLLTLLKQARAFGVGIVLATQNPVDLDYKGLSNTGTWFLGRLQTERDKARVIEGLEGIAAGAGAKWDRQVMEQTLAGLSNRIFLINNVHDDEPLIFETRWAMSYLRGPLTRNQIKQLMDPIKIKAQKKTAEAVPPPVKADATDPNMAAPPIPSAAGMEGPQKVITQAPARVNLVEKRPVLGPGVPQYFVPVKSNPPSNYDLYYQPGLIGGAEIHFSDTKAGIDLTKYVLYKTPFREGPVPVDWDNSIDTFLKIKDLRQEPEEPAAYGNLISIATRVESYSSWNKEFINWLLRNQKIDLLKSPVLKEYSQVNESERDFRIRLQQQAREQRDGATDKLRQKYAPKFASLQEQLRKAQASVEREREQVRQQQMEATMSFGATILSSFLGRKVTSGSISRAKSTVSKVNRSMKEKQDVERAQDTVAATQQRLHQLELDFNAETAALAGKIDPLTEKLEIISLRPARTGITIQILALGWFPNFRSPEGELKQAW
jgi:hypothetical protein